MGFAEIAPYYKTPVSQTLFMELALYTSTRKDHARVGHPG